MSQISIVKLSEVEKDGRFDAEFYKPEYLEVEKNLKKITFDRLVNLTKKIDVGFVGTMASEYSREGVLLLQTNNIDEFHLNLQNKIFINQEFNKKLKKSAVQEEDILIARSGSFGKASIYLDKEKVNSADIIIIQSNEKINPFYLVTFINSNLGRSQLFKFASGGLQGHVNLTILIWDILFENFLHYRI